MKKMQIPFSSFPYLDSLASYSLGLSFFPAVCRGDGGYQIRVLKGVNKSNGHARYEWEYFKLDKKGVIIRSPHGLATEFNNRVQIIDIENMVEEYKNRKINH